VNPDIEYTAEFATALDALHKGHSIFLTGKAGTGKSTLIRDFIATSDAQVFVTATTGIAALNIGGETVHRLLGMKPGTTEYDVNSGSYHPKSRSRVIRSIQTLIIDEASMLRADTFDMIVAILEMYGPQPEKPFGGVQLVLVGDLYQLPPVVRDEEKDYFRTVYDSPFFFSGHRYIRELVPPFVLTKVFRQSGDPELTQLLNEVREGDAAGGVCDALNRRVIPDFSIPNDEFWLTLTTTNRIAAARNSMRLDALEGVSYESHSSVEGDISDVEEPNDPVVKYKVGAQIMMLTNDPADRWVNGTVGTIVAVDPTEGDRVLVEFRTGGTAWVGRHRWETTRPSVEDGRIVHQVVGVFEQVPFRLAWAITIHKSQGQTLDRMVVDLSGGTFSDGQTYVALSRATSLEGIVLTKPVAPKDLRTDIRVKRFLSPHDPGAVEAPRCAISVWTVGADSTFGGKARPVEIGVAFSDGSRISSIVNPQRDPGDALADYGLSNDDLLIAPTLTEAWSVIAPFVTGCTPVGADLDRVAEILDHEAKRLGQSIALPLGTVVTIMPDDIQPRTALQQAVRDLYWASLGPVDDVAQVFSEYEERGSSSGYLLSRDGLVQPESAGSRISGSQVVRDSLILSEVALHKRPDAGSISEDFVTDGHVARAVTARLRSVAEGAGRLSEGLIERLDRVEALVRSPLRDATDLMAPCLAEVLRPGARVCFTGSYVDPNGEVVSKRDLEALAGRSGLTVVKAVTKSRCDVLVTAQIGSQSRKSQDAKKYNKAIVATGEFLDWVSEVEER